MTLKRKFNYGPIVFRQSLIVEGQPTPDPEPEPEPTPLSVVSNPVLAGATVGDALQITPATWNYTPNSVTRIVQGSANGTSGWAAITPTPTHYGSAQFYRVIDRGVGEDETPVDAISNVVEIEAAPVEALPMLTVDDVEFGESFYHPTAQTTWFKFKVSFPGAHEDAVEFEYTTTDPVAFPNDGPEIDWRPLIEDPGDPGWYVPWEVDAATDGDDVRPDSFAVWRALPDSSDRAKLRLRQKDASDNASPIQGESPPAWYIEAPEEVLPQPSDPVARQLIRRSDAQLGVVPDNPELFTAGIFMGDGQQYFTSIAFSADGAKVLAGMDAAQTMFSRKGPGRAWFRPRGLNQRLLMTRGVQADPANTSRWFGLFTAGYQSSKQTLSGLYVSTDDTDSWSESPICAVPNMGNTQTFVDNITCYPPTGGASSRWYFAVNGPKNAQGYFGRTSAGNNGSAWAALVAMPWATYGRMYTLKASPLTSGLLYLGCAGGFFKSENHGAAWAEVNSNLPNGSVTSFWLDPDNAAHAYVVVVSSNTGIQGLYETNNLTASSVTFTRIRACRALWLAVGAKNASGQRILFVKCGSDGFAISASGNSDQVRLANGTWITRTTSAPNQMVFNNLGAQPVQPFDAPCINYSHWLGNGQHMSGVQAHPTDPNYFLMHGDTSFMVTDDGGPNETISMAGFGGLGIRSTHYDLEDKDRITFGCLDIDPTFSENGGLSMFTSSMPNFEDKVEDVKNITINSFHGWGIVRVPDDVAVAAYRGRIIVGSGPSNSINGCLGYYDPATGQSGDWMGSNPTAGQSNATGGGAGDRVPGGYLRHNHNKLWLGSNYWNFASSGTPAQTPNNRAILGAAQDGTEVNYGFQADTIYRATTIGGSWSLFHAFSTGIRENGKPIGGVSLYDGRRMFFRSGARVFTMLFDNGGTAVVTTFNLENETDIEGQRLFDTPFDQYVNITDVVGDALDERYIYVGTGSMGTGKRVFRGKFNSTFTSIAWENVTGLMPHGAPQYQLFTMGLSGCLHASPKDMGSYIIPAPDDWAPRVGMWKFSGQPSNGQTLTINGQTFTFRTSGASGLESNIGANLSATLTAAAAAMNASVHADVSPCTYTARYGDRIEVTMDNPTQFVDEPFPLTAGTTDNATVLNEAVPCRDYHWGLCPLPIYELPD